MNLTKTGSLENVPWRAIFALFGSRMGPSVPRCLFFGFGDITFCLSVRLVLPVKQSFSSGSAAGESRGGNAAGYLSAEKEVEPEWKRRMKAAKTKERQF